MDINKICEILPHRYPILLVDRVEEIKYNESIVAYKNISIGEQVFQGHYPGHPIYPGVMIVEGLAQAGGILGISSLNENNEDTKEKLVLFTNIDDCKFKNPVYPGDKLIYDVKIVKQKAGLVFLEAKAYVEDKLVCQANLKAVIKDK